MPDKSKLVLIAAALALAALACQTVVGGLKTEPTATFEPAVTAGPPTADTPEERVSGTHPYTVAAASDTCELSLTSESQSRTIEFDGSQVRISNNNSNGYETYDEIGPYRYLRINDAGRPVVAVFSLDGYVLEIYNAGDDIDQISPCGTFTFTLAD